MDCIVTAGPTYEPLDQARRITNFSTGRLGCELANHLTQRGHRVCLLRGEQATWAGPLLARECVPFSTGTDLASKLSARATRAHVAVFHAAAVADFRFGKIWRRDSDGALHAIDEGKIKTTSGTILAELSPTPKIVGQLRTWFPSGLIVGWKYEVEGGRESVISLARKQIADNKSDACVANGPGFGAGFGLVTAAGTVKDASDREQLFQALDALLASKSR